jgi:hypothetical protein
MLRSLENGNGVGTDLLLNGAVVHFDLAVFAKKSWFDENKEELEYGFISKAGHYIRSTYSGGTTGMGSDRVEALPKELRLVTTDLAEMQQLAQSEEERVQQKRDVVNQEKREKVVRLNNLPTEFGIGDPELDKLFVFKRSEASYNPAYSSKINVGVQLAFRDETGRRYIWLSDYQTKNKKFRWKKFAEDFPQFDAKEVLPKLVARKEELDNLIKTA